MASYYRLVMSLGAAGAEEKADRFSCYIRNIKRERIRDSIVEKVNGRERNWRKNIYVFLFSSKALWGENSPHEQYIRLRVVAFKWITRKSDMFRLDDRREGRRRRLRPPSRCLRSRETAALGAFHDSCLRPATGTEQERKRKSERTREFDPKRQPSVPRGRANFRWRVQWALQQSESLRRLQGGRRRGFCGPKVNILGRKCPSDHHLRWLEATLQMSSPSPSHGSTSRAISPRSLGGELTWIARDWKSGPARSDTSDVQTHSLSIYTLARVCYVYVSLSIGC